MNYAVMYEFAVDTQLEPVQGPVQRDQQRGARLHLQGHGGHHAEQRHAVFDACGMDLRAEPIVISVPAVEKTRYYSVHALSTATPTTTATSAAAPRAVKPATTWWSARTGKARRPPASRRCSGRSTQFSLRAFPHPALQSRRHGERGRSRPATRRSRCPRFSSNPRHRPPRPSTFPKIDKEWSRRTSTTISTSPCSSLRRRRRKRTSARKLASIGIGPGKTFAFKDLSRRAQGRHLARHEGGRRQGR